MANTDVRISMQGDTCVPDVTAVPVVAGDTVTFWGDKDFDTALCMQKETTGMLSPTPDLTVPIPAGSSAQFTFLSAQPWPYCMVTQAADWPYPDKFDSDAGVPAGMSLAVHASIARQYSGPDDQPQT